MSHIYENKLNDYLVEMVNNPPVIGSAFTQMDVQNIRRLGGIDDNYAPEKPEDIDPDLPKDDIATLVISHLKERDFARDAINSMNTFYRIGIDQIITKIFKIDVPRIKNERKVTEEDKSIAYYGFKVEFLNTKLSRPTIRIYNTQEEELITPNKARRSDLTYSAPLYVDMRATKIAILKEGDKVKEQVYELKKIKIANIPVMVKSELCNLNGLPKDLLAGLEESTSNPGGSFIIGGKDWAINNLENLTPNMEHGYRNNYQRELTRLTFLSKPGDAYENSQYIVIHLLNDNQLNFVITTNKSSEIELPFYMIYYVFGMTKHRDIIDSIVFGIENTDIITEKMKDILAKALFAKNKDFEKVQKTTNVDKILTEIARKLSELAKNPNISKDENAEKKIRTDTLNFLDKLILPHIQGDDIADIADTQEKKASRMRNIRISKLRYLSILINKTLKIHLGVKPQTDRDDISSKRNNTPGIVMGKALKARFNVLISQEIKKKITNALRDTSWSSVNLADEIKNAIKPKDLEDALVKSIVTGESVINVRKHEINNRVSSQQVIPKNPANIASILRNTTTHGSNSAAKATTRAQDMRSLHNSYYGYFDSQSKDTGPDIGLDKQLCCMVIITEASNSFLLKNKLLSDKEIIHRDSISNSDMRTHTLIYVNGDWIGGCQKPYEIVAKYRTARRYGDINRFTSIVWEFNENEIKFWTDVGRLSRPLIIVYNNESEYLREYAAGNKKAVFRQWIKLKKEHIWGLLSRKLTIEDLVRMRILEYISGEEQKNVYLATNLDVLRENANNILKPFTHCDIEQAIFGVIELAAPMANHTAGSRGVMATNQCKQGCAWYQDNWPHRIDKNAIFQIFCDNPIVKCLGDAILTPSSQNITIAYMDNGWNQEDSLVLNQTSIDRGLFNLYKFHVERTQLDKGESFGNNNFERTLEKKEDAIYSYCDARGLIAEGTIVRKYYVLVIKKSKIQKSDGKNTNYDYVDRSLIYKLDEPGIVETVLRTRNHDDVEIVKIKIRLFRPIIVGDKLASLEGCKGILALTKKAKDMPYCEDGTIPDIIINPHSIPTRMVIGQIIETLMAQLAVMKGCIIDAMAFRKFDIDSMIEELAKKYGIEYGGHRRMYNPKTGMWYDSMIFIGPASYRQLQKFIRDEHYAMSQGPTCALTRQPLDGKQNDGGLRFGEMEKDCLMAHGSMKTLQVKFYNDSDGLNIYICRICGNRAIVNERKGIYKCMTCGDNADISAVQSSWVANLFFNHLSAMGVKPTFELEPYTYQKYL